MKVHKLNILLLRDSILFFLAISPGLELSVMEFYIKVRSNCLQQSIKRTVIKSPLLLIYFNPPSPSTKNKDHWKFQPVKWLDLKEKNVRPVDLNILSKLDEIAAMESSIENMFLKSSNIFSVGYLASKVKSCCSHLDLWEGDNMRGVVF